jgi:hypothetical protein
MPDMFMAPAGCPLVEVLPDDVIGIPFMGEDPVIPDIPDIPDIGDDEAGAAAAVVLGITATANGIRRTASTVPRAPSGLAALTRCNAAVTKRAGRALT